eukprot:gene2795-4203_t
MKSFRTRNSELDPILNSYEQPEKIAKLEKSLKTKKILCSLALVLLIMTIIIFSLVGGGITTAYFVLRQVLEERCAELIQNGEASYPSRDSFQFFPNHINNVRLIMPRPRSWARNSIAIERSDIISNVTLRITMRAYNNESLSLISYAVELKGDSLSIVMTDRSGWNSIDCPTALVTLGLPKTVKLSTMYLENNSKGNVDLLNIHSNLLNVDTIGQLTLQQSKVSRVEVVNTMNTIVRDHQCSVSGQMSSVNINSNANIALQNIKDCSKIAVIGGNPITISDINTYNCSIHVNSQEGNQNYFRLNQFRSLTSERNSIHRISYENISRESDNIRI